MARVFEGMYIGGGWAAHFLRHGLDVVVYDPAPGAARERLGHELRLLGQMGDEHQAGDLLVLVELAEDLLVTPALLAPTPRFILVVHLLSGGMMLGAWFMATDYVTSPSVRNGQILFGIGCGLLTMLIRLKGGFPEGVMFAILIMNCFAPLIDRGFRSKVFGAVKPLKAKETR